MHVRVHRPCHEVRVTAPDLAVHEPEAFSALAGQAKAALAYLKDKTPGEFQHAVGE